MRKRAMRQRPTFLAFLLLVTIGGAAQYAEAVDLGVNCNKHDSVHRALQMLARSNPQGPNTITVFGSCKENLVIQSMDRLTLIAKNGASITDRSSGLLAVVDIEDSQRVTLKGFTINGGGAQGILCSTASLCYLTGNTILGPGTFGVNVIRGSRAFLESNVIRNWARGSFITGAQVFSSNDVYQSNGGSGIAVLIGSYFESLNSTFNNNGDGIEAGGSSLSLNGGTISENSGIGIRMLAGAGVAFVGPTITGNGGVGVHLEDGAAAGFLEANITGNLGGLDVDCEPQFPITRFIDRTGAITNCVEPASNSQSKPVQ
jgi:Right handed beta helix region